jgi:hypothetical protein
LILGCGVHVAVCVPLIDVAFVEVVVAFTEFGLLYYHSKVFIALEDAPLTATGRKA